MMMSVSTAQVQPIILGPDRDYRIEFQDLLGMERPVATVSASPYPPWVNPCFEQDRLVNCTNPGVDIELLEYILGYMGWNVEYIHAGVDEAVELVRSGKADILGYTEYYVNEFMIDKRLGFTVPVLQDEVNFVLAETNPSSLSSSLLLSIFHWSVWMVFIISVILVFFVRIIIKSIYKKINKAYQMRGGKPMYLSRSGNRFMVLCCFFSMTIFLGVYSNFLAIALSRQVPSRVAVNNLDEFAWKLKNKECRAVLYRFNAVDMNEPLMQVVNPSVNASIIQNKFAIENLQTAFIENPPLYVDTDEQFVAALKQKSCYVGVEYAQGRPLIESRFCGIRFIRDEATYSIRPFVFYFYANSTVGKHLAEFLRDGSADDLYRRMVHRIAVRKGKNCYKLKNSDSDETGPSIELGQVTDLFIFLQSFVLVAIILFVMELTLNRYVKKMVD